MVSAKEGAYTALKVEGSYKLLSIVSDKCTGIDGGRCSSLRRIEVVLSFLGRSED